MTDISPFSLIMFLIVINTYCRSCLSQHHRSCGLEPSSCFCSFSACYGNYVHLASDSYMVPPGLCYSRPLSPLLIPGSPVHGSSSCHQPSRQRTATIELFCDAEVLHLCIPHGFREGNIQWTLQVKIAGPLLWAFSPQILCQDSLASSLRSCKPPIPPSFREPSQQQTGTRSSFPYEDAKSWVMRGCPNKLFLSGLIFCHLPLIPSDTLKIRSQAHSPDPCLH